MVNLDKVLSEFGGGEGVFCSFCKEHSMNVTEVSGLIVLLKSSN